MMDPGTLAGVIIGLFLSFIFLCCAYQFYDKWLKKRSIRYNSVQEDTTKIKGTKVLTQETDGSYAIKNIIQKANSNNVYNPLNSNLDLESAVNDQTINFTNDISDDDILDDFFQKVTMDGISKAGYLFKKSTGFTKEWQPRWFFMKNGCLYYSHSHSEVLEKNSNDIQAIQIANLTISTVKTIDNLEFQIISPGTRGSGSVGGVYNLRGGSTEEVNDWILAIKDEIETSLSQTLRSSDTDETSLHPSPLSPSSLEALRKAHPMCADCGSLAPQWASLNLCVLICIECSGVHRGLGSHVSKIRSLKLDRFSPPSLRTLIDIGGDRANNVWEGGLSSLALKPSQTSGRDSRESFISSKYLHRSFLDPTLSLSPARAQRAMLVAAGAGDVLGLLRALAAGADVASTLIVGSEETERTALHLACDQGHSQCAELLLQWNAPWDKRDCWGHTPLDLARKKGDPALLALLERLISSPSSPLSSSPSSPPSLYN